MNDKLKRAIESFCSMLPNLTSLHHPKDEERLMQVVVQMHLSNVVFSEIENFVDECLSQNNHFESNEPMRKEYIEEISHEVASMKLHLEYLVKLNYFNNHE